MKMSKYLNKRIFIYLSLALIFLIVTSFVVSSGDDLRNVGIIDFDQDQRAKVTRSTNITFTWNITKEPSSYLTGINYYLEIRRQPSDEIAYSRKFTIPTQPCTSFPGRDSWIVPPTIELGNYTSILRVPYDPPYVKEYRIDFEVVETLLVIQKVIDNKDKSLKGWKFTVTNPDGNTRTHETGGKGEIIITIPEENAGKYYSIEEIPEDNWKPIPLKQTVKVPKGETKTVPFQNIYQPPVTKLSIQKFGDSNRNSRIDSNDARLRGWRFKVTDPDGHTKTYSSNNNGEIIIDVAPEYAGKDYTVEEILQPGWKSVLPIKQTVNVPGGSTTTVQFLNAKTLLLIQKFGDSNRNNKIDSNDVRLQGWKFKVTDPGGKHSSLVTNSKGEIIIEVLGEYAGKEYIIEETLLPLWVSVLPIEQPVHVKVPMGETKTVQFLNKKNDTQLIIRKFYDYNQNGEIDSEDERLRGWNFSVTDPVGKTTTKNTDTRGEIIIVVPEKYAGKDYTIEETLLPDWEPVLPIEQPVHVKVPMGETETVQFLNKKGTLLIIQKFNDSNRNKEIDSEDKVIPGWNFNVTDPAGNTTPHRTNDKGEILIDVPPKYVGKEYTIVETPRSGWSTVDGSTKTEKPSKGKPTPVRFLNQRILPPTPTPSPPLTPTPTPPPGHLKIQKFYDPNVNKVQDPGEQGLPNWNFNISPNVNDGIVTTDANGVYRLHNIPVGIYTITEEPRGCRWTSSTDMTQKVDVEPGKEATALFGNYIAECCMLPGCVWKNSDKNIEVCKSVDPCSVALGKEAEVTVHLGLCVDPEHILNGTKVRNISVIDTLHNQFTIVEGSFSEDPNASWSNPDGTTTLEWNISSLCCEEWHVSFNVTVAFALSIDVTESYGVSMIMYDDPNIEETKVVKELPIPAGKLLFVLPTPTPSPSPLPTPKPPGFEALLAIAGLLAVGYMMWRRKR